MRAVFYNGKFSDFDSIRIPLCDRAVFFGDGVYDVVIGRDDFLYLLEEHLERFYLNIKRIGLTPYCSLCEIKKIISELVVKSGEKEFMLYMQASGESPVRAHARSSTKSNLLIAVFPEIINKDFLPMRLRTVEDLRGNLCDLKSINLLPAVLASSESASFGFDESVYIRDGIVTECAHSALAIVKNGVFYTHPLTRAILPSITRARALDILRGIGIKCKEIPFGKDALYSADEVLILSTTKFCRWASEIDGVRFAESQAKIGRILSKKLVREYQKM